MTILIIAPHADDEVIGCGGTIAKLTEQGHKVVLCIATNGKPPIFDNSKALANHWPHNNYLETQTSNSILGIEETVYLDYPAAMLENVERYKLNGKLVDLFRDTKPEIVFIPHYGDMQKDHQIVAEAVMVAARPKYEFAPRKIYSYETLSETAWNAPTVQNEFMPNVFIDISDYLNKKIDAMQCYQSEISPFPNARSIGAIEALARYRGALINKEAAEAFMLIRAID